MEVLAGIDVDKYFVQSIVHHQNQASRSGSEREELEVSSSMVVM